MANIQAAGVLYGVDFTPWEVDMLLELDSAVLRLLTTKEK